MSMPIEFLEENRDKLDKDNIKIKVIGRRDRITKSQKKNN